MFVREFKIRSNNQIKSSEKKGLIKEILKQYPQISEEELKQIIKVKESEVCISKIVTHDSIDVCVYLIDKIPYFFKIDKEEQFIPTVYFLWKFPNLFSKFFTYQEVFTRLINGADFMLPGVITEGTVNLYSFKHIKKNDLCALCIKGNNAPIAIGRSYFSGDDMYMSGMRGKCLNILQIYQDSLWALGDRSIQVPFIPIKNEETKEPENFFKTTNEETSLNSNKTELNTNDIEVKFKNLEIEQASISEPSSELKSETTDSLSNENNIDHEMVLQECFLCALKYKSKEFKIPVIVSTFMKIMQSCCPPNVHYDLKQTRYKKISVFLKEMEVKGVIKTKELQKGVLSITDISKENELLKYLKKPEWLKEQDEIIKMEEMKFVFEIFEMFKIDGSNENFFRNKFKKGDILNSSEIRECLMNYIKEKSLQLIQDPKFIRTDESISKVFFKNKLQEKISFEEFFATVFLQLTPMHHIRKVYQDKKDREPPLLRKGKFQPVEFKLESRGSNKKVTNIYNLGTFELDLNQLVSKIRKDIGCSVSLVENELKGSTDQLISIQGNQIHSVSEILRNDFGIQFKHMSGLELGVKA